MGNRYGRRDGLHEVLGRSPDAGAPRQSMRAPGTEARIGARWWALRVAAALLIGLAVLVTLPPEQAAGQTVTTLISNTGQNNSGSRGVDTYLLAQPFGTGSSTPHGYNLASIVLDFEAAPTGSGTLTVTVREDSSGDPSATPLYTLTNPTLAAGLNEFSAPTVATLDANTTYWVVARYSASSGGPTWWRVDLARGVDTGASAGWTMDAAYKRANRNSPSNWSAASSTRGLQIAVKGITITNPPTVANEIPDQTATVGLHLYYQFPTNTFTATNTGDTLTYTATKADGTALPSWLTFRGGSRIFFGTPMAGDVGTVAVKVTASDGRGGSVSDEFDIVVSAAPAARRTQALVSNIGQHPASSQGVASLDVAQGFTTGRNPRGYTLTSIEVRIQTQGVIDSAVVRKTDPNTGDLVATLTGPASGAGGGSNTVGTGAQTFTAPSGVSLEPSTEYFVVFESDASSNGLQISYTGSPDEDEGGAAGWSINNSNHWRTKASTGNFLSFPDSNQIRVNGVIKRTSPSEQPGEDLPGSHSEMRTTYGLVSPGQISSGELTAAEDDVPAGSRSPVGLRGDYFRLKVQAGRSYRLQAFFNETVVGSVPLTTGGSIKLASYDIATGQRAGLSPGSDHNRDDGVTIVHFYAAAGDEYYVKVNAYDHYNGDKSRTYHGEYHLVLTDITGVTLLTNNMIFRGNDGDSGGDSVTLKDETVGTNSWGASFIAGTHSAGYKIDRLQLFIEDTNSNATPVVTIRATSGSERPGDTVCTFVGLDGYASGIAPAAEDVPDTLYPDPDNCDNLEADYRYWVVVEAQDTTKSYKVGALVVTASVTGPAAGWTISGTMMEKDNSATTPAWSRVTPDQHILFRLWGTPKTSSAATAADPPAAADPPTVSGAPALSDAGSDGEWTSGETVEVTFTFSEAVTVDATGGTPTVGISLGGTQARSAAYLRGSGTTELVFGYTLTAADGSHGSMIVTHNSLALNGGTIRSAATSVDADLSHAGKAVSGPRSQNSEPKEPANSPATGAPAITGTAQVGETLRADTSGISDADGLTLATFAHQWIAGTADIAGATGSSHTLTSGDQGRSIKVKVRFTDDAGNSEELISAATFAVALPPLTATIHDAPDSHDGQSAFTFDLRFSEEFGVGYRTLRDHAFTVTGGDVVKARRLNPPSSMGWEITVEPDGNAGVTVSLPATTDCADEGAICTPDGRVLSNSSTVTVPGPATQSQEAEVENSPATGLPTISGTVQVGETLTVDTSAIADADGTANATFTYQWIAGTADITGATGSSHTLTSGDQGRSIKVKVRFTDDAGNSEELISAATFAVALPPLTARTSQVPAGHDGNSSFTFELHFSEDFGLSYKTLRDYAFTVTGGEVVKARRLNPPSSVGWEITVMPSGDGTVTIVLPITTQCAPAGAICTDDGRKLSNGLEMTVSGP